MATKYNMHSWDADAAYEATLEAATLVADAGRAANLSQSTMQAAQAQAIATVASRNVHALGGDDALETVLGAADMVADAAHAVNIPESIIETAQAQAIATVASKFLEK